MHLKKISLILFGVSVILVGVIFVLYKNNQSKKEEVVDIFKVDNEEVIREEEIEEEPKKVIVDIKGMIKKPGVYEVDEKARVNDVIKLAGGLLKGADTSLINLAKIVIDEMTIIIPSTKEVEEKYKNEVCICDCPEITNDACIEKDKEEKELININTASKEQLTKIPKIGEAKAEAIIKYREENNGFKSIDEVKNISGIGDLLFEEIKNYITV